MRKSFPYYVSLALGILLMNPAHSQDYLGFANSVFAGVNGIDLNPASIVNSPRKWDVTVIGLNLAFGNNYLGLQKRALDHTGKLTTGKYPAFADKNFINDYLNCRTGKAPVSIFAAVNVTLPSFMFTRQKYKDAFAFSCRTRAYVNIDGIDPLLAHMLLTGATDSLLFGQRIPSPKLSIQTMVWAEYGITYGKTVMQTRNERFNVAGRLKLLQGLYAAYVYIKGADYKFISTDSLAIISTHVDYGHSTNLEFNKDAAKFAFGGKPNLGLDIGATYEFYPLTEVRSQIASQSNTTPLQHEYRYKIGFSIQDIGWITYLKPPHAHDFTAEFQNTLNLNSLHSSGTTALANLDDTLQKKFSMIANDSKFRMNLPTVASLQADYYAGHNFYVNGTLNYALQFKNNEDKVHEVTTFSITPRWDWKWLGLYMPVSYNKYSRARLGLCTRIGPLIVGMADILPLISRRDIYGMDFYFMLKVPHIHLKMKNKRPRSKSKFDVNRWTIKKPARRNNGKTYMPKKDVSPKNYKDPTPDKEKQEKDEKIHADPDLNQEKKVSEPPPKRIHLFKRRSRHGIRDDKDHSVYFKL